MLRGAVRAAWYYQFQDVMVASGHIEEMKPIYRGVGGLINVGALCVFAGFSFRKVRRGEWLWLIASALMMLRLAKFTPLFGLIAGPVLAATLPPLSDRVLRKPIVTAALGAVVLIAVIRIGLSFPRGSTPMDGWINRRGPAVGSFPTAAADYVEKNVPPRRGRIINEFNWGGYLAWRLGEPCGRWQVFLDERTQLYTPQFWRGTYLGDDAHLAAVLRDADGDVAVIPVRKSRFRTALEALGWRNGYRDDMAEVWMPPS
jgi:hypothetical protein